MQKLDKGSSRTTSLIIEAKNIFTTSKGCHDWDHTERVLNMCKHIGRTENADMDILLPAAILHDIGREEEELSGRKKCHAKVGADLASKILARYEFSDEKIKKICLCVLSHRSKWGDIPNVLEAKVLFDADKLDSLGAIGLGRSFVFAGELGARVHHPEITPDNSEEYSKNDTAYRYFLDRSSKIVDKLLTAEGKRIGKRRDKYMRDFFKHLDREVAGKV